MRAFLAALSLFAAAAPAAAQQVAAQDAIPVGQLPETARPTAYRLDLTIDPSKERFSGRAEIDVDLKERASSIYMHGRDLNVARIAVMREGVAAPARWTQVNPLGVARVDFDAPQEPGRITLQVEYDAAFASASPGLYRTEVAGGHYAWTQFEPIEARSAFPSFDELRFKTPYTVTITAPEGSRAVTNGADASQERVGAMVRHRFQTTPPIPPSLVAFAVGPFDVAEGSIPAQGARTAAIPLRIFATRGSREKMQYALDETPRIVQLLENYFGIPYPYAKLDQLASPLMGGAMENVGAVIYGDPILLLAPDASTRQRQTFGMVVAHELAHQWFGNLVTPAWWEDTWLKESFANWMGYRVGAQWRPELNIEVGSIDEALGAMNTDALVVGRPIRQPITDSGGIDASFDAITYGKGGQVIAMIENYLGREAFQRGVQFHLRRFAGSGTATADDFFQSLAQSAGDPRVVEAMRSFVNQQGVPVVTFRREGSRLVASQGRYAPLGAQNVPATQWVVPLCVRSGEQRSCTLLDRPSAPVALRAGAWYMPNAGGQGYYRFDLPLADWDALIAAGPTLTAGEALATIDSLWASFRAGRVGPERLIAAARSFARHSDSSVVVNSGERLAGLESAGLISAGSQPAFRQLIVATYAPPLQSIGFEPRRGAHAQDAPDRQRLRGSLVGLLAGSGAHEPTRATLRTAATAYLGGDDAALDPTFLGPALSLHVTEGRQAAAEALLVKALASSDTLFRSAAVGAIGSTGDPALAPWVLQQMTRPGLRPMEMVGLGSGLLARPETRDVGFTWLRQVAPMAIEQFGAAAIGGMAGLAAAYCDAPRADEIRALFQPMVERHGRGGLGVDRAVERVRNCANLKAERGAALAAALR